MPYKDREKQLAYLRRYNIDYQKKRYEREKNELIATLGGKCACCGTTNNLQFDHINPEEKSFAITAGLHSSRLHDEISKCQLLCKRCHLKKTRGDNGWKLYDELEGLSGEERRRERMRIWRKNNPDKVKKYKRRYAEKNRGVV